MLDNHSHPNFFKSLQLILDNMDITFANHLLLKSAVSKRLEETSMFLLKNSPKKLLPEVMSILDKYNANNIAINGKNLVNNLIRYNKLNEELPEKRIIKKMKM